jgi:hypothetical protein
MDAEMERTTTQQAKPAATTIRRFFVCICSSPLSLITGRAHTSLYRQKPGASTDNYQKINSLQLLTRKNANNRQEQNGTEFIRRSKKVLKYQEKYIENKLAKWNSTQNGGGRSAQHGFRDHFAQAVGAVGFDKWQSPSDNPHRRLQSSKWPGRHGSRTNPAWIVSSDYPKSHLKASATSFR